MEIVIGLIAALLGAGAGVVISGRTNQGKAEQIAKQTKKTIEEAERAAEKRKAEILAEAEERQKFVRDLEKSIQNREGQVAHRLEDLDKQRRDLDAKNEELGKLKEAVREIREKQEASLERIAKMNKDEAKAALLSVVEKSQKDDILKKMKALDELTETEVENEARKRLSTILARIASDVTAENTVFAVTIPSEEMKGRLIGKEGRNIIAFEKATGVDLLIDDSPDTVLISSFDPVRREIGRVALEQLIRDGRVQPARIEEIVQKATE